MELCYKGEGSLMLRNAQKLPNLKLLENMPPIYFKSLETFRDILPNQYIKTVEPSHALVSTSHSTIHFVSRNETLLNISHWLNNLTQCATRANDLPYFDPVLLLIPSCVGRRADCIPAS